jgi:hypothetical protein
VAVRRHDLTREAAKKTMVRNFKKTAGGKTVGTSPQIRPRETWEQPILPKFLRILTPAP